MGPFVQRAGGGQKSPRECCRGNRSTATRAVFSSPSVFKVLGYLNRNALDTKNLIKEIKAIASVPTERYFFNVSDEAALLEKAATIGEHIFSIEGKGLLPPVSFQALLSGTPGFVM